jgi:hypothetical protein
MRSGAASMRWMRYSEVDANPAPRTTMCTCVA